MVEALKIKEIAEQAGKQNDCRIYDIYKHKDRLQIFIDKKSRSQTINLKDCENVFRSLQFLLDMDMPHILENRRLEVSSPGVERSLREKWHFEESIGKMMKLSTISPVEAQNVKTGKSFSSQFIQANLTAMSEQDLKLQNDSLKYSIPFSKIKSAKLIFKPPQGLQQTKTRGA